MTFKSPFQPDAFYDSVIILEFRQIQIKKHFNLPVSKLIRKCNLKYNFNNICGSLYFVF